MKILPTAAVFFTLAAASFAQSFEASVSGGVSQVSNGEIGSLDGTGGSQIELDSGFRMAFRLTLNPGRFYGYELGYAYNRTHLAIPGSQSQGMAIHQGFGGALLYATPEGSRVRPFAAGGIHFSNFVPPGASAQYGQGENKFGFNYGGGIKVRVTGPWQVRFDVRQYNTGKPFGLPGASGRFLQNEISVGVGYAM
jgi:opacity protein-like surface antigen